MWDLITKIIKKKEIWVILIISFIALALRLYRLGANDLWYDEVFSVLISKNPLHNWNPPVYFITLDYWIKLFGVSEFSLRFPSLVFGVISIPCLFFLGKTVFNSRVGISACLLMCLSSFHLWYAQEARPYSLSVFLSILSTYFFYRFLTEGRFKFGLSYVLSSILGLYSDITYYHLVLLFTQLLGGFLFVKKHLRLKLIFAFSFICLIFSLRAEHIISKFLYVKDGFWISAVYLKSLIFTIENFTLGYNVWTWLYWLSDLVVLIILFYVFLAFRRKKEWREKIFFFVILSFFPLGTAYIFSKIFFPVYLGRAMIIFSPYYYILLALGIDCLANRLLKKVMVVIIFLVMLVSLAGYYLNLMPTVFEHHPGVVLKKPFKAAVNFVENNFKPGDTVMHTNSASWEVFKFYSNNKTIKYKLLFAPKMIDTNWNRPLESGGEVLNIEGIAAINSQRIWVISCGWERNKKFNENSKEVNSEMSKIYKLDLSLEFDGLWVYRYIKL
ncbi:MAG TPA: glycosyltransferase family 39 protein [Candidatus Omnitrophota bacterium]|nr:glycosyltransferase family 39 protein [Candidatus Omnitrophota bacterium]